MDIKFGKIKSTTNISAPTSSADILNENQEEQFSSENFFSANHQNAKEEKKQQTFVQNSIRLNDYDSNILENRAYIELSDEALILEHKIANLEQVLEKLDKEILTLESLGTDIQLNALKERRLLVLNDLKELNKKYSSMDIGAKISGKLTNMASIASSGKKNMFSTVSDFVMKQVLGRLSKSFNYSNYMKDALKDLNNINESVDELILLKTPYGETINRYEMLTAYINKANSIHSQIYMRMKKMGKLQNK